MLRSVEVQGSSSQREGVAFCEPLASDNDFKPIWLNIKNKQYGQQFCWEVVRTL